MILSTLVLGAGLLAQPATVHPTYTAPPRGIVLAAITKENGGGKTPGGNANGVPSKNPAGKEPPGQNKKETGPPR